MTHRTLSSLSVVALLVCGSVAAAQQPTQVKINYPTPVAFQTARELRQLLASLGANDAAAQTLLAKVTASETKLANFKTAADNYLSRPLQPADLGPIADHNAACKSALDELIALVGSAQPLLLTNKRQLPALSQAIAGNLAAQSKYQKKQVGTDAGGNPKYETYCNVFVTDFAKQAFGYNGFQGKRAGEMVDVLTQNPATWQPLYDKKNAKAASGQLAESLRLAQQAANEGYLVVVGLKSANPNGAGSHVAVVRPGDLAASGNWKAAGLPELVPQIAQAGNTVFADKHLAYGFSPESLQTGEFVIYVQRP